MNILVSRLRFMGDVILTIPLLHTIRLQYPDATITYLTEEVFASLLNNHPDVDEVLIVKKSLGSQPGLVCNLLKTRFDVAIDLFGNPRSALLIWLSGAKRRIGGDYRGRRYLFTDRIIDHSKQLNAIEYHMRYGDPLGLAKDYEDPKIYTTDEEKDWASRHLKNLGYPIDCPIIAIHTGASWPAKKWLPERFAKLATQIRKELNCEVYFTTGPGEEKDVQSVIDLCACKVNKPEVLSVRKLAAILSCVNVFVSNDCGPMHLAPAVGTPTIGIFGPGEPEIWFPYSKDKGHQFIHHEIDCSRCHQDFCEKLDCMRSIKVQDVFNAVMSALKFSIQSK